MIVVAEYDAGTAFVSILPSTRGFAQRLKREISGTRVDYTVQVRPELDRRQMTGLQAALKSLPAVVLDADATAADREVAALRGRLEALSDKTVGIDISAAEAKREVDSVRTDLERLSRESPDIAVRVDAGAASAALEEVTAETLRLDGRTAKVKVDADTARAAGQLAAVHTEASRLDGRRVGLQVTADIASAVTAIGVVALAANQFANRDYKFQVTADTSSAVASIARLVAIVSTLGGLAGVIGGLAGAVGGLGAAGAVAAGGLGAAVLGFLGVGDAISALSSEQESSVATSRQAAKQQEQHARQVDSAYRQVESAAKRAALARSDAAKSVERAEADGEKSVAAARRQASASIASAVAAREAADRRAARSARDVAIAQGELNDAWEAGRRSLQDLQDQLDSSQLDQEQAALDLKAAKKALDEARATGNTDDIERADLAYRRQLETIDQLNKRTKRLQTDNTAAQRAGVEGTDQYRAALDRVAAAKEQQTDADRAASAAAAAERAARTEGDRSVREAELAAQQRVDDAREQGARQVEAANDALLDSQRALTEALTATGDAGTAAGDKVGQAFAGLSPEAARFARYLFGLKPILEGLSATAATALFPPLIAGIDTLLTRLPLIDTVVGQLAGGVGAGLQLVLATLANPWWSGFFTMLGNAAGTIIPMFFGSVMLLAQAAGTLIGALLPIAPASLGILDALSRLIMSLSGPLVQALAGMFPSVYAFIDALGFLGPFLVALSPILNVLGIALSQILGAALQALIPILTALTPLIQVMAEQFAGSLVAGIQAATPWLVGFAQWASQNPGLVIGVISVIGGLLTFLKPLAFLLGLVVTALHGWVVMNVARSLLTGLGLAASPVGRALMLVLSPINLLKMALPLLGKALSFIASRMLAALGPVGMLIAIFTTLFATNEQFRGAVMTLLDALGQLVGAVVSAFMPVFDALAPVLSGVASVVAELASSLATALVPIITVLAGWITEITPVLAPLAAIFLGIVGAIRLWAIAQTLLNIAMSANPLGLLVLGIAALVAGVVWAYQNVEWFRNIVDSAFRAVGAAAMWLWTNVISPVATAFGIAFTAIGQAAQWLWTNVLSPVFGFIGQAAKVLFAVVLTVLIAPLILAWKLLAAAAMWLWDSIIKPIFTLIGQFIGWVWTTLIRPALTALVWFWQVVLAPALSWLYNSVIVPIFNAIGTIIRFVWDSVIKPTLQALVSFWQLVLAPALSWLYNNIIKPIWDGIGAVIRWVWDNVIQPAFQAVVGGLDWLGDNFTRVVDWIRDVWGRMRGYLAKPINFMIDTVWNGGVVPAWNAVAGLVGLGKIDPLPKIAEARTGGRVDSTGKIHGPGTGTSDSIWGRVIENDAPIKVSTDEMIMNARATRLNYPVLAAMNGGATIGDSGNERRAAVVPVAKFAAGGPVWQGLWDTVHRQFPNARLTDSTRPGAADYHGRGMAIDVAGSYPMAVSQMLEIDKWIGTTYPGSTELIHYPIAGGGAINLKNGGPHTYGLSTQLSHANHVHWAQDPRTRRAAGTAAAPSPPLRPTSRTRPRPRSTSSPTAPSRPCATSSARPRPAGARPSPRSRPRPATPSGTSCSARPATPTPPPDPAAERR
ncbi:hypothetical protein WY02_03515 [Pseudonocardia sp. AL041005-10]|nr:hypothetical protein WY02_03515 [Pseudonocardia sp. AL041005-10]